MLVIRSVQDQPAYANAVQIGDPTAAGNTCDDANDANGCIFTLNLLTPAVTEAEITAAVAGISAGAGAAAGGAGMSKQPSSRRDPQD